MMMKVFSNPSPSQVSPETGIGRVVLELQKYLPAHGIEITENPFDADLIVTHAAAPPPGGLQTDVLQCHGLYWSDIPGTDYSTWHATVNTLIAEMARQAIEIIVPANWVAEPFKRDMRLCPWVIGHGVDCGEWKPGTNEGYILWNKNRGSDVCDPSPAIELGRRGYFVYTTYGARGGEDSGSVRVIGPQKYDTMRQYIQNANIYLATTIETFGIGTLEALAAGVPVLGYNWGGTADIVTHKVTGYLVEPGDYAGLEAGIHYINSHRAEMSAACVAAAQKYSWDKIAEEYAHVYNSALSKKERRKKSRVSIVITNYNYAKWVGEAVKSAKKQKRKPEEIIVVDDGSTDDSLLLIEKMTGVTVIAQKNQGVAAARNNGIAAATGDYIVCLDADDRISPDFVKELAAALDTDRGLGIVYGGLIPINGETGEMGSVGAWPVPFSWDAQAAGGVPPSNCIPSACMFRRDMWVRAGGYKQTYAPGEDAEFWTRGLSIGYRAKKVTDLPVMEYRVHSTSASRTKVYKPIDTWHPWMSDKNYPFAAPAKSAGLVRSYAIPVVSVIIPVGPLHGDRLPGALNSLLGQSMRAWEVIIVDDGGMSVENYDQLEYVYPFARIFQTEHPSSGAGAARNIGIMHAKAPVVVFLDADDYLEPDALKEMAREFEKNEGRYIYTDWVSYNDGEVTGHITPEYQAEAWIARPSDYGHCVTVMMPTVWARDLKFDEAMETLEDADFFIRAAVRGYHGKRLPKMLLNVRTQYSTRRVKSEAQANKYKSMFEARYNPYITGEKKMSGCCGGSAAAAALVEFKRRLGVSQQEQKPVEVAEPTQSGEPAFVRLEYIGINRGAVQFRVKSGRTYNGADNAKNKYADVHPSDVDELVITGRWRIISRPVQNTVAAVTPKPVEEKAPEPPKKSAEEIRHAAEERLLEAKRNIAAMPEAETPAPAPKRSKKK